MSDAKNEVAMKPKNLLLILPHLGELFDPFFDQLLGFHLDQFLEFLDQDTFKDVGGLFGVPVGAAERFRDDAIDDALCTIDKLNALNADKYCFCSVNYRRGIFICTKTSSRRANDFAF